MLSDAQFEALQEYYMQVGIGDSSKSAKAVLSGQHTDFLSGYHYIESVNGYNFRITERGKTVYWNESYHRLKDVLFQINEYTKLAVIDAKDVDSLRNRLQGILMLISGDIQLRDHMIEFQNKSVFPLDYNFALLDTDNTDSDTE